MTDRGNQCAARLLLSPPILFSCITGLSTSLPIQPLRFAAWLILSLAFHPSLHPHLTLSHYPFPKLHFAPPPSYCNLSLWLQLLAAMYLSPSRHVPCHPELYLHFLLKWLWLQMAHIKGNFKAPIPPNCGIHENIWCSFLFCSFSFLRWAEGAFMELNLSVFHTTAL